jgi:hypothetical protein
MIRRVFGGCHVCQVGLGGTHPYLDIEIFIHMLMLRFSLSDGSNEGEIGRHAKFILRAWKARQPCYRYIEVAIVKPAKISEWRTGYFSMTVLMWLSTPRVTMSCRDLIHSDGPS